MEESSYGRFAMLDAIDERSLMICAALALRGGVKRRLTRAVTTARAKAGAAFPRCGNSIGVKTALLCLSSQICPFPSSIHHPAFSGSKIMVKLFWEFCRS